MRTTAQWAFRM